ncbi:uncharacterized protein LOC119397282 isoform X4 [Rhipicephalus sanguineus]|uniref:uncharacterized protein LOC119397282 isoform X4 n=1 Tax=Rhipicephalus sanguineus TaxID=34632 RepID=UPI0020C20B9C|nr:uncharacterized protein LOC119397282 isoform X4 [Rhipicephalus sanguineus]
MESTDDTSWVVGSLWSGDFPSRNVYASYCEHDSRSLSKLIMELHNASIRLAMSKPGPRPVHFAEPCPGYCGENNPGGWCSPNCRCRVLNRVDPPIYMCFEEGKNLPMGFE